MNSKEKIFKRFYKNMSKEEIIRIAIEDKMRADRNARLLHKTIENNKSIIEEKDKEIERLYNLVNTILRRIAILEREVEKYEGF